jgi:hypothetical protein
MTPAEQLASKRKDRKPRVGGTPRRKRTWVCSVRDCRERLMLSMNEVSPAVGLTQAALVKSSAAPTRSCHQRESWRRSTERVLRNCGRACWPCRSLHPEIPLDF